MIGESIGASPALWRMWMLQAIFNIPEKFWICGVDALG